jgi:uncharacterized protein YbaA (DUF1428 family)
VSLRARIALCLFAAVALVTLSYAFVRVAARGRFATPYSTYGAGPEGAHALLLLAQRLGYTALPFTRELSDLPRGTLVAFGGCHAVGVRKVSRPEREALQRWVEAGGLLISIGVADVLPQGAGLSFQREQRCADEGPETALEAWLDGSAREAAQAANAEVVAEAAGPPLSYLLPFSVHEARALRIGHDAEATEILTSSEGTLGLTAPYGRGRVVLLGIPAALTNATLSDGGGLVFARLLRAFAPAGPILFDEYHLGMGERRSLIGYVRDLGYAPPLLQGLLAVIVVLFAFAARVAPAQTTPYGPKRIERSFFDALSALFAQSQDTRAALDLLANAALARIAQSYHAHEVPAHKLEAWLKLRGLFAVAHYARNIARHATAPLAAGETLTSRAQAIDQDATMAVAIATLGPGSVG